MLTKEWQQKAGDIAYKFPEEPTSSLAQMVLEECFTSDDPDPVEVELAYTEIKWWLVTYMACNPDT